MKLALDLDSMTWRNPASPTATLTVSSMRRGGPFPVDIVAVRDGKVVEFPGGSTGKLQLNADDTWGGDGFASDSAWETIGRGAESLRRFEFTIAGALVDAAFADDPPEVSARLQLEITSGSYTELSAPLAITLQNAVIQP